MLTGSSKRGIQPELIFHTFCWNVLFAETHRIITQIENNQLNSGYFNHQKLVVLRTWVYRHSNCPYLRTYKLSWKNRFCVKIENVNSSSWHQSCGVSYSGSNRLYLVSCQTVWLFYLHCNQTLLCIKSAVVPLLAETIRARGIYCVFCSFSILVVFFLHWQFSFSHSVHQHLWTLSRTAQYFNHTLIQYQADIPCHTSTKSAITIYLIPSEFTYNRLIIRHSIKIN